MLFAKNRNCNLLLSKAIINSKWNKICINIFPFWQGLHRLNFSELGHSGSFIIKLSLALKYLFRYAHGHFVAEALYYINLHVRISNEKSKIKPPFYVLVIYNDILKPYFCTNKDCTRSCLPCKYVEIISLIGLWRNPKSASCVPSCCMMDFRSSFFFSWYVTETTYHGQVRRPSRTTLRLTLNAKCGSFSFLLLSGVTHPRINPGSTAP